MILCLLALALTGCGNVYLRGEAMTAAEVSTLDAYGAALRAAADPETPAWAKAYTAENFWQWRLLVRSGKKNDVWGPKLGGE